MKSIGRLIISASFALAVSGCHSAYNDGLDRLAAGEYQDAAKLAQEGLKENPNDAELNLLMAEALVGDSQFAPAEAYARRAFKSEALKAPAGRTLGKILWELGQPIGAVDVWREARSAQSDVVADDDYVRGLEIAISTAMSIHEFEKALALRDELTALSPEHPEVQPEARRRNREELAQEQQRAGELLKAASTYASLYADFKDARYEFERGRVLLALNDDGANDAFNAYVDAADADEGAARAIAVAERATKANKPTVAIVFYDRALDLMKNEDSLRRASVHLMLASLLLTSRAVDQGREQLNAYIEQYRKMNGSPVSAETYVQAANVATNNRAPDVAIDILEEGLKSGTPSWRTARMLAELYARRSRNADVERVLKAYVDSAESQNTAQINVGRWAASRRNYELAVFFLEAAVAQKGASSSLWLELARTYAATGRLDDMRRALDSYLKASDNSIAALTDVAALYRGQRMYDQAEASLLKAFKRAPTEMGTIQDLESLYREWGRNAKVRDVYDQFIKARGNKAEDYSMVAGRFMRQNEWDDALPYLMQAAAKGDAGAWLQAADVYKRQRKERDMKDALNKYLQTSTNRQTALEDVWQRYRQAIGTMRESLSEELVGLMPTNTSTTRS
ncbi:MAG: tetratricopeptide repeat protein [bacterium]